MSDSSPDAGFDTDIAVVGMAGRFPGAPDIAAYWRNLRDGVESIETFTDEQLLAAGVDADTLADPAYVKRGAVLPDMEQFDAPFFGFSPREASIMDPQHRHFLECAWEALENAGHMPDRFKGSIGVFGGSGHNAYLPYNLLTNPKLMASVGFFLVRHTGNDKDFLTTRVSYLLNLKGPSINVQTACSTSLVAIHLGVQSLLNRECDMALAGGVTIEMPHRHGYHYKEGEILSPDGHCHAFDAGSQGTVFGSAVGIVVLRRLADAIADGDHIHAVIKGSAINNDGSGKVGYLAPSVDGQAQAIAEAISLANVDADTITYVEAHGTGTPVGDPIEIAALTQAFRQSTDKTGFCGIGSVKSNIGHADTAAGVASFIKVALSLQHAQLPPSLHYSQPNPACQFETTPFTVNAALRPWLPPAGVPRRAGVSSLGVGGTNAHVVLEQAPPRQPGSASRDHQLLLLSARTPTALAAAGDALAQHLVDHPEVALADVAHTLREGRQPMAQRRAVVAATAAEAVALLRAGGAGGVQSGAVSVQAVAEELRDVAFLFAGGGAQYPNMGADLYRREPVYRAVVDEGLALVQRITGQDLRTLWMPEAGAEAAASKVLEQPSKALPALLTMQVAQARLWMSWGVEPAAMIGHSMGEYTAAHLAGVFSFEDALRLVEMRGRLFETLPVGAMLSVPLSLDELAPHMDASLSIAAINGPKLIVAAGPVVAIEALQARLAEHEVEAARVRISVAAHSSMLEPILEPFGAFLRTIRMQPPKRPFVSNLSGTWITPAEATDPAYWVRHLRQTVRFADGLQELLKDPSRVLLEVGPGKTMASLSRQHPGRSPKQPVFNSSRHADEAVADQAFALGVLGKLWAHGLAVDWDRLRGPSERRLRVPLPTYRFDHQRHWVEPGRGIAAVVPAAERPLVKLKDVGQWFYVPQWQRRPLAAPPALDPAAGPPPAALVFMDDSGLGERLLAALHAQGRMLRVVRAGKAFSHRAGGDFTINPASAADYEAMVGSLALSSDAPLDIFHTWMVPTPPVAHEAFKATDALLPLGFYSLLHLAQALGVEDWTGPVQLLVVSTAMQRVAGETGLQPAKATVLGPCKVIPQEFRHIRCRSVDVEAGPWQPWQRERLVEQLLAEAASPVGSDDVVALRAGERWVQDQVAQPLPAQALGRMPLRERGVYLVTGGLGGVGLALARRLAARAHARLVLVGRTALPPPAQWDAWLQRHDADDATSRRIREVGALQALGAEVMLRAVDTTDLAQMTALVREVLATHGALHGVLHTAGVLNDGVIQLKDAADAAAVLAPKVQGTMVLDAALDAAGAQAGLDFLVLFSSISSFSGLAGQVDYAAANAFLDAYAQARATRSQAYCVAVNWSQWAEVGMAAELARRMGLGEAEPLPAPGAPGTQAIGHPLVAQRLRDAAGERVYQTPFSLPTHWLLDEHKVRGGEALIPGTGYLEIVRTAYALRAPAAPIVLREVTFLAPFVVHPGETRDLRVHLQAIDSDTGLHAFRVQGQLLGDGGTGGGSDGGWVDNVRGRVGTLALAEPDPVDMPALRQRCAQRTVDIDPRRPAEHLDFGPRWRNVERVVYGTDEALINLRLPPAFAADLAQFPLHPALMDMATAGAQALLPGFDAQRDFFVPASYGELRVFAPLRAEVFSHVRLRAGQADEPGQGDLAVYDVTVLDASGRVLVDITDFTMIRVRDKALLARGSATAAAAHPASARAVANPVLAVGMRDGILPDEGAEALERILASRPGPQVAVSPQALEVLLARLRAAAAPEAASPAASAADAVDDPNWRAPATATEKLIAQMWAELLGLERVSATGHFFDLGGHSLLAVQVINRLRKRTGRSLALTALLQAPTVETLAALIEPPGSEPAPTADAAAADATAGNKPAPRRATRVAVSSTLIPIRRAADKTDLAPLFFVHDGNGETLLYRTLALQLEPGRAVYGLQPLQRDDGSFAHTRISEMAAFYVSQVRAVQPQGPYYLTGLCAGGVISFEMARQLQDVGQVVAFVGIIDAADVHAEERPFRLAKERFNRFIGTLDGGDASMPSYKRIGLALPRMVHKAGNLARYEVKSRLERRRHSRAVLQLREQERSDAPVPDAAPAAIAYLPLYEVAHRQHEPGGLFRGGDVVLFRATRGDGSLADKAYVELFSDPLLGWPSRVAEPVTAFDIPGGHSSLLQEPNVRVLARDMQAAIHRAHARQMAAQATALAAQTSQAVRDSPVLETPDGTRR